MQLADVGQAMGSEVLVLLGLGSACCPSSPSHGQTIGATPGPMSPFFLCLHELFLPDSPASCDLMGSC